jgi:hypothetical protein
VHEILETKEWVSIIEDNISLGRTFGSNFFRYPAEPSSGIRNPLQVLSGMRLRYARRKSWQYFCSVEEVLGSFEG